MADHYRILTDRLGQQGRIGVSGGVLAGFRVLTLCEGGENGAYRADEIETCDPPSPPEPEFLPITRMDMLVPAETVPTVQFPAGDDLAATDA